MTAADWIAEQRDLRFQMIDTHLAAARVAINAAWNLMPFDTPRLLRERCKQIEGDIIDAADILSEIREALEVEPAITKALT